MGSVFLLDETGRLRSLDERPYASEAVLQDLLGRYPALLAGEQMTPDAPRQWILVGREFGVPSDGDGGGRWSLDHLFLDQDGIPTLVEVKRSSDTRIRREVVGQMLDYAANGLVYWPLELIRERYEAGCTERGDDPELGLSPFLATGETADSYWQRVRTNLQAGRVRLVFVADVIPPELKRIVEFLNGQMRSAEVLAVEVRHFEGDGVRTLVPRVIGATADSEKAKGGASPETPWSEETYFPELARRAGPGDAQVARLLFEWAAPRVTRVWWGKGARDGSFVPILNHGGVDHQLFAVYTYGKIEIYFQYYVTKPPFASLELRRELASRLNAIEGVSIPDDALTRRPSIALGVLSTPSALQQFTQVFEWFLDQVERS
jgi:hypothetical protein